MQSVTKSSDHLSGRESSFPANAMSKQIDVTVPDSETLSSEKSKRFTVRIVLDLLLIVSVVSAAVCLLAGCVWQNAVLCVLPIIPK